MNWIESLFSFIGEIGTYPAWYHFRANRDLKKSNEEYRRIWEMSNIFGWGALNHKKNIQEYAKFLSESKGMEYVRTYHGYNATSDEYSNGVWSVFFEYYWNFGTDSVVCTTELSPSFTGFGTYVTTDKPARIAA